MALKKTPMIRYSLKDRGRKHTGQTRNFNIKALYDSINGAACQETVNSRGMIGYYGHFPRIRFGMHPSEGGLDSGKYVPVEPAFITTHLRAFEDGTIEHQAEFQDTNAGKLAAKLFDSQVGGFSSAIDQNRNEFYGFDYVLQPNFLTNSFRGVSLDDAMGGNISHLTYDDVYAAELDEHQQSMNFLLDSVNAERNATHAVIERLQQENEELLSMLSAKGIDPSNALDSAFVAPISVSIGATEQLLDSVNKFRSLDSLPQFAEPEQKIQQVNPLYNRLLNRFGR